MINTGKFYHRLKWGERVCPYCDLVYIWEHDKDENLVTKRVPYSTVYDSGTELYAKCPNCGKEICVYD